MQLTYNQKNCLVSWSLHNHDSEPVISMRRSFSSLHMCVVSWLVVLLVVTSNREGLPITPQLR
jgi:hypothetical protein